jgi:hypothetical protein
MVPFCTFGYIMVPASQRLRISLIENKPFSTTLWPIYGSSRGQVLVPITLAGPTLVNKNRTQQEHDGHNQVGKNQYGGFKEYPMGGIEIENDEQQKNDPDRPKVILKPLHKEVHGTPLAYFDKVGFTEGGNLPDLSRRVIHRTAFCAP